MALNRLALERGDVLMYEHFGVHPYILATLSVFAVLDVGRRFSYQNLESAFCRKAY
jgi:hypothetical protein